MRKMGKSFVWKLFPDVDFEISCILNEFHDDIMCGKKCFCNFMLSQSCNVIKKFDFETWNWHHLSSVYKKEKRREARKCRKLCVSWKSLNHKRNKEEFFAFLAWRSSEVSSRRCKFYVKHFVHLHFLALRIVCFSLRCFLFFFLHHQTHYNYNTPRMLW